MASRRVVAIDPAGCGRYPHALCWNRSDHAVGGGQQGHDPRTRWLAAPASRTVAIEPMAEAKPKKGLISHGIAAQNRKARYDYTIRETLEAGLVLKGPEVKSLRNGRASLTDAWAGEREGEMWLFNAYIPEYQGGVLSRFEPRAPRKLLLKKKQIDQLLGQVTRQGATLVPLQIHFNDRGRAKVLLGVGEGRKKQDKRAAIADRDWQRDKARLMRARG